MEEGLSEGSCGALECVSAVEYGLNCSKRNKGWLLNVMEWSAVVVYCGGLVIVWCDKLWLWLCVVMACGVVLCGIAGL